MQTQIPAQQPSNPYNLVGDASIPIPQVQVPIPQVQIPIQAVPPMQVAPVASAQTVEAAKPKEGFFEKFINGIIKTIAKASGNPDPFTGQPAPKPIQPPQNIQAAGNIPVAQPAPSQGIFGQIGGVFSGIAETAKEMVGGAVSGAQQVGGQVITGAQQVGGQVVSGVQQAGGQVIQTVEQIPQVQIPLVQPPQVQIPTQPQA